jgi:hypothetical protein
MNSRLNLLLSLIMLAGCGPARVASDAQRDSSYTHIVDSVYIRDTVVQWRVPEGSDSARIPDSDTSRLETGLARSTAYVKGGELHHSLENKAGSLVPIFLSVPERARTEEKGITRTVETVEYVEVEKDFNGWQRFLMGLGWAVLGVLALRLARWVKNHLIP